MAGLGQGRVEVEGGQFGLFIGQVLGLGDQKIQQVFGALTIERGWVNPGILNSPKNFGDVVQVLLDWIPGGLGLGRNGPGAVPLQIGVLSIGHPPGDDLPLLEFAIFGQGVNAQAGISQNGDFASILVQV